MRKPRPEASVGTTDSSDTTETTINFRLWTFSCSPPDYQIVWSEAEVVKVTPRRVYVETRALSYHGDYISTVWQLNRMVLERDGEGHGLQNATYFTDAGRAKVEKQVSRKGAGA